MGQVCTYAKSISRSWASVVALLELGLLEQGCMDRYAGSVIQVHASVKRLTAIVVVCSCVLLSCWWLSCFAL